MNEQLQPTKIDSLDELNKLPPGLYEVKTPRAAANIYDPLTDEFVDAQVVDVAAIREPEGLTPYTFSPRFRPDGRYIVQSVRILPGTETYRGGLRLR